MDSRRMVAISMLAHLAGRGVGRGPITLWRCSLKQSSNKLTVWVFAFVMVSAAIPAEAQRTSTPATDLSIGYQVLHIPGQNHPLDTLLLLTAAVTTKNPAALSLRLATLAPALIASPGSCTTSGQVLLEHEPEFLAGLELGDLRRNFIPKAGVGNVLDQGLKLRHSRVLFS
jgi:hypothetical protein